HTTKWKDINADVDLTKNKYFITPPVIIVWGNGFKATVKGSGKADWICISINQNGVITHMNIKRAIGSEGQDLVALIRTQERVYFSKNNRYTDKWEDISAEIDLTNNKFFITTPVITVSGNGSYTTFTATITGSREAKGVSISINQNGSVTATGLY
ncbi:MAG: hypothetical protein KKH49_01455, partial [Candidatus Omnitrophica bacterium]|nr:hypothetical protein [Candidatus Omnitrophota bacterium]